MQGFANIITGLKQNQKKRWPSRGKEFYLLLLVPAILFAYWFWQGNTSGVEPNRPQLKSSTLLNLHDWVAGCGWVEPWRMSLVDCSSWWWWSLSNTHQVGNPINQTINYCAGYWGLLKCKVSRSPHTQLIHVVEARDWQYCSSSQLSSITWLCE